MRQPARPHRLLLVAVTLFACLANAQTPQQDAAANASILTYIDHGWDTLSRSMGECKSLVDPKVTTPPVLYLPTGMPTPDAVASAQHQCNIDVRHLPRKIIHM